MKSIRRSLLIWFLALTVLMLGIVGWIVDNIVRSAISKRKESATKLVEKQFEERKTEELERVDQSLLDEARAISQSLQFFYTTNFREANRVNYVSLTSISFSQVSPLFALMPFGLAANPNPTTNSISSSVNMLFFYDLITRRITEFTEEEHFRDFYQIVTLRNFTLRSKLLGEVVMPDFNRTEIDKLLPPNWIQPDNVLLSNGMKVRRVVYAAPVPFTPGFRRPPTPPGTQPPPGGNRRTTQDPRQEQRQLPRTEPRQDARTADLRLGEAPRGDPGLFNTNFIQNIPRVYVQTARPLSVIEEKYLEFDQQRIEEIATIDRESQSEILKVRWMLIGLAAAAILLTLLSSLYLIKRGLQPVQRLSQAVSQVSERDFRLPISREELSEELLPVHERLTTALNDLKRAFDREKQAVADISHELRTPVASMAATIDVSLRKPRTAEQYKETLSECRNINRQLGRLVERVMTLANLDSGNDRAYISSVDPNDLVVECISLIKPLAESKGLVVKSNMQWDSKEHQNQITTDVDKVREVLMNILHNAVEYTETGSILITTQASGENKGVDFIIRDTGIGMNDETKQRIFERFFRADASRTDVGVHAGLGMAIVKEYMNRIGGKVAVESKPSDGSQFTITVPNQTGK